MGKWTNEALRMRPYFQKGAQHLDDEEALVVKGIYAEWEAGVLVKVHEKRIYHGTLYRCLKEHTTQADWTPDVATSLWAEVLIPDPEVIPEWKQPDSTNGYMKGDTVTHNGKTYESLIDNNVWEPGTVGTESLWKEIEEVSA